MKLIPLTKGKFVMVDDEDYEELSKYKWQCKNPRKDTYYAARSIRMPNGKQKTVGMHRIIMGLPDGYDIDHIDGNGLNNCRDNLRVTTRRQNLQNRHSITSSKYVGVSFDKESGKWLASIRINNRCTKLGRYKTEKEAFEAYISKVKDIGEEPLPEMKEALA